MSQKNKFQTDLASGQAAEKLVAERLSREWGGLSVEFNNTNSHDFEITLKDGGKRRCECKLDAASAKYGNSFQEIRCSGKPSGLNTTKADFVAIYMPHISQIFLFKPKSMLKYFDSDIGARHRVVGGGDDKRATGVLVPIDVLKQLKFVEIIPFIAK